MAHRCGKRLLGFPAPSVSSGPITCDKLHTARRRRERRGFAHGNQGRDADSGFGAICLTMDDESGSGRFGTSTGKLNDYEIRVGPLRDRLVAAQRPLRILGAVKWDHAFERAFFAAGCREQPPVTRAYYEARPLSFNPVDKTEEFAALERDIRRQLGALDAPGLLMARMCREYRDVIHMLTLRGTPEFSRWAARLYGTTQDIKGRTNQESDGGRRFASLEPSLRIWSASSDCRRHSTEKTLNAQE